jgi:two-component system KDP operon response regulator KdpE
MAQTTTSPSRSPCPELLARLRVAVRHGRAIAAVVDDNSIEVGSLQIDVAAHEAMVDGHALLLPRKEFALLVLFARNAGKVLTHRTVVTQVWGGGDEHNTQPMRTHIALLRKKLTHYAGTPLLVTEPGVGYRLIDTREAEAADMGNQSAAAI